MMNQSFPLTFGQLSMRGDFFLDKSNPDEVLIPVVIRLRYPTKYSDIEAALCELEMYNESLRSCIDDYYPGVVGAVPRQRTLRPRKKVPIQYRSLSFERWDEVSCPPTGDINTGYCWSAVFLVDDINGVNALKIWVNHLFADIEGLSLIQQFVVDCLYSTNRYSHAKSLREYSEWERKRWTTGSYASMVINRWRDAIESNQLCPLKAKNEYVVVSKHIPCKRGYLSAIRESGTSMLALTVRTLARTRQYSDMPLAMLVECANRRFPLNRGLVCTAIEHGLLTCDNISQLKSNGGSFTPLLSAIRYAWYNPVPILELLPSCLFQSQYTIPWQVNVAYPGCEFSAYMEDCDYEPKIQSYRREKGAAANYVSVTAWADALDVFWSRAVAGDNEDMIKFINGLETEVNYAMNCDYASYGSPCR